jgi:hypothetical protein
VKLLSVILWLLLAASAMAADVKLSWDAGDSTWTSVRIYERTGTAPNFTYAKVGEALGSATEITLTGVTPGVHVYVARAFNTWESGDSNTAATPPIPAVPLGLKYLIIIVP